MIQFSILGPLEVRRDGEPVHLPGNKERNLLAQLVIHAREVVSTDRLIEDLWGDDPPGNPANALQAVVSRVRRALDSESLVLTKKPGYVLDVDAEQIDARRFEDLLRRARLAGSDDASRASKLLAEALSLWRGAPFADLANNDAVSYERARLEELRVAATDEKVAADLALGRHGESIPDLERLVAAYPLRERLRGHLMLALYRSGRQGDALAVYHGTRQVLADELGVDPDPELEKLYLQILRKDPSLTPIAEPLGADSLANLPLRITSFIGREAEVAGVRALIGAHRLVTVIGPGGSGKTSLAIEVGRLLVDSFDRGVWLEELAPISDSGLLAPAICETLGLPQESTGAAGPGSAIARLSAYLRTKDVLLILDNCEHMVQSVAELCDTLLASCAGLKILATSREVLGAVGEFVWSIPPLSVPREDEDAGAARQYDSVRLLEQRAVSAGAELILDDATSAAAAVICRRLDGMPLAIELAASRARSLSLHEIASRLNQRFALLTTSGRSHPRHRTLRAAIDWSYELLTSQEQTLFQRLAVFSGGWKLDAAEDVCSSHDLDDVLDLLGRLVDRSLVVARAGRFFMLETIHAYANERLVASGTEEDLRARHATYFKRLAESSEPGLRGADQAQVLKLLRGEEHNLRQALQWGRSHARQQPELGLQLAAALGWYWYVGRQVEGRAALKSVLAAATGASDASRALALQALSLVLRPAGCIVHASPEAADAARESVVVFDRLGMRGRAALSRLLVAVEGVAGRDISGSLIMIDEARETLRADDDAWGLALADFVEMEIRLYHASPEDALTLGQEAAARFDALNDAWGRSAVRLHLGFGLRLAGRAEEARQALHEAVAISRDTGLPFNLARSLLELGEVALYTGEVDEAQRLFDECDEIIRDLADETLQGLLAGGRGDLARYRGNATAAGDHYGSALTLFGRSGVPRGEARALVGAAAADLDTGDLLKARPRIERGMDLAQRVEDPAVRAAALEQLARLSFADGLKQEGVRLLQEATSVRLEYRRPRSALAVRDARHLEQGVASGVSPEG